MNAHGIVAKKNAGAGHRWSHRAYFAHIRSPRGEILTALDYVTRFGFAAMVRLGHAAEGNSADEAIERLREVNNLKP